MRDARAERDDGPGGTERGILKWGLLLLGLPHMLVGGWAVVAPAHWYETFPGFGHAWLVPHGPFQEHLARDFGAALLALGLLLTAAGVFRGRRLVRVSLSAWLAFAIPHLLFHVLEPAGLPAVDRAANLSVLALVVVLPVWLWIRAGREEDGSELLSSEPDSGAEGTRRLPGARIAGATDWLTDLVAAGAARELGQEPAPARILGHHRPALLGATAYETAVMRFDALEPRFRRLASLQAARVAGCPW